MSRPPSRHPGRFDDGTDARPDFRGRGGRTDDRKLRQLCAQVQRAISLTLVGECQDAVLQNLTVEAVTPAPDASRLKVSLSSADPAQSPLQAAEHIDHANNMLRRAVAAAINRRKVPELTYEVVRPDTGSSDGPGC